MPKFKDNTGTIITANEPGFATAGPGWTQIGTLPSSQSTMVTPPVTVVDPSSGSSVVPDLRTQLSNAGFGSTQLQDDISRIEDLRKQREATLRADTEAEIGRIDRSGKSAIGASKFSNAIQGGTGSGLGADTPLGGMVALQTEAINRSIKDAEKELNNALLNNDDAAYTRAKDARQKFQDNLFKLQEFEQNERIAQLTGKKLEAETAKLNKDLTDTEDTTDDIQEFQFAVDNGYKGSFVQYMNEKEGRTGETGVNFDKLPSSYQEWSLAGKPNTYESWLKVNNKDPKTTTDITEFEYARDNGYFGGDFLEWQTRKKNEEDMLAGLTTPQRQEYNRILDNMSQDKQILYFNDTKNAYDRIVEARQLATDNPSAKGVADLTMLRAFAKLTDPTSSVREEEFESMESAQSALARYGVKLTNQMITGERLTDTARNNFLEQSKRLYETHQKTYLDRLNLYQTQADTFGIPRSMIFSGSQNELIEPSTSETNSWKDLDWSTAM